MIRHALSIVVIAALLGGLATPVAAQMVILVRHAEKADGSSDPDLSEAGRARAEALSVALAGAGIDQVLVTPLKRTAQTAGPAAQAGGTGPEVVAIDGGTEAHVSAVAARARQAGAEETVLITGHSNTVPLIARLLGAEGIADMPECEYDRLIVLRLRTDGADAVVGRYGEPSECPAG